MNAIEPHFVTDAETGHVILVLGYTFTVVTDKRPNGDSNLFAEYLSYDDACEMVADLIVSEHHPADTVDIEVEIDGVDWTDAGVKARRDLWCQCCMEGPVWSHPQYPDLQLLYSTVRLCRPCDDVAYADYYGLKPEMVAESRDRRFGPPDHSNVR